MSSPLKCSRMFCSGRFSLLITASWLFKILVIELYGNYWIGQKVRHDFSIKCNEKTWTKFLANPAHVKLWSRPGEGMERWITLGGFPQRDSQAGKWNGANEGMGHRKWDKRGGTMQAKWTSLQHWGLNPNLVSGKFCLGSMMDTARALRCRLGGEGHLLFNSEDHAFILLKN